MHLGLGLYRHMLTPENLQFARQAGCTHIVAHLVDYFRGGDHGAHDNQPTGALGGWGLAGDPDVLWTVEQLVEMRRRVNDAGLELEAIENFDPAHWHDVLLDGPRKAAHYENVKETIRRVGAAGIPIMGYNFSIAGVCGRTTGPFARGGATSVGMDGPYDEPMPRGMAWNMVVDPHAGEGFVPLVDHETLWRRHGEFLDEVLPVAEEAGVALAAHPDDPPMPTMRGQARLVYQPRMFQQILDRRPSPANKLEFCIGTIAEMTEGDVCETVAKYARQGAVGYVHLRNVAGKVPDYRETFVDDGDVNLVRVLRILHENGFNGVVIPDHAPQMACSAPWHAGMAYALGYIRAALQIVSGERTP
ncbi:MAG: mannonate dehydratase [Pirellulales bacterium]|nr:mannonate dehydratase [Pirellulales bacterium]